MQKVKGVITAVNMPLITVSGLEGVRPQEVVLFSDGNTGVVLSCQMGVADVMVLEKQLVSLGSEVVATGESLKIPVGKFLLGNTISPRGKVLIGSIDAQDRATESLPIEANSPSLVRRAPLSESLFTGISLVDSLLPLAKGQRELVVGDRKTGKSLLLLQSLLAQVQQGSKVVYCLIGKKREEIKYLSDFIAQHEIADSVVIVASSAIDSSSEIILTPFTAMTVAEYLRDQGDDVLIIFDDLTTHAKYYREVALLSRSFPGRDSYPGDIFYVHARLLERAGSFFMSQNHRAVAAITALPVAETFDNELTDYIVSNLISITDGHLLFDSQLLARGQKPPIHFGLSVTRVGKQVQTKVRRQLSQKLSIFLNKYERTLGLTHFGSELSDEARLLLKQGSILMSFLRQKPLEIVPLAVQVVGLASIMEGWWDSTSEQEIIEIRQSLSDAYRLDPEVTTRFDDLLKRADLTAFTKMLNEKKKAIAILCQR
jgi:F-type H+-transporting ATPase subunit alpha